MDSPLPWCMPCHQRLYGTDTFPQSFYLTATVYQRNFSPHPAWSARLGSEQNQLPCRPRGTSSSDCQKTEACMVRACHDSLSKMILQVRAPWSVGGGGGALQRSEKKMLDGQRQKGRPYSCLNCVRWPPTDKTERGSWLKSPSCPSDDPVGQGTIVDWTNLCGMLITVPKPCGCLRVLYRGSFVQATYLACRVTSRSTGGKKVFLKILSKTTFVGNTQWWLLPSEGHVCMTTAGALSSLPMWSRRPYHRVCTPEMLLHQASRQAMLLTHTPPNSCGETRHVADPHPTKLLWRDKTCCWPTSHQTLVARHDMWLTHTPPNRCGETRHLADPHPTKLLWRGKICGWPTPHQPLVARQDMWLTHTQRKLFHCGEELERTSQQNWINRVEAYAKKKKCKKKNLSCLKNVFKCLQPVRQVTYSLRLLLLKARLNRKINIVVSFVSAKQPNFIKKATTKKQREQGKQGQQPQQQQQRL